MAITEINLPDDEFVRRTSLKNGDGKLYLKCISIGQGDCTFIVCPNGKRMMIDAGTSEWGNSSLQKVKGHLPYKNGQLPLDMLVMSHPDKDHYNQLGDLLGKSYIGKIYYGYQLGKYSALAFRCWVWGAESFTTKACNHGGMEELFINQASPAPKLLLDGGNGCQLNAIAANVTTTRSNSESYKKNTASIVVMCTFGSDKFLITGDATCDTETFILAQYKDKLAQLKVKILRVAHHGSATSSMPTFVRDSAPSIAIISSSKTSNGHGLPRKTVVDRLLPNLEDRDSHTVGYYVDPDGKECATLVEDSEDDAPGKSNLPYAQITTKKSLWETSTEGTFSVVLTGA